MATPEPRAYGRATHLEALKKPRGPMLTQQRLTDVGWTLGKIQDARSAVSKLLEGEPELQPPTDRMVTMRQIESDLVRLHEDLEALFS